MSASQKVNKLSPVVCFGANEVLCLCVSKCFCSVKMFGLICFFRRYAVATFFSEENLAMSSNTSGK